MHDAIQGLNKYYLSNISPSDKSFDDHKQVADEVARLYALDTADGHTGFKSGKRTVMFGDFARRIFRCGDCLTFIKTPDKPKLVEVRFCKSPNCPMCQWRRSLKWRAKFLSILPTVQEKFSLHKWLFLTLTIRNCDIDELRSTISHLNKSFNRLSKLVKFPFDGYVKSVEVTRVWDCYDAFTDEYLGRHGTKWIFPYEQKHNTVLRLEPTTEVHPHLHIIGMVPSSYFNGSNYINQSQWTELWKRVLKVDYKPIVHVKAVKGKKGQSIIPKPEEFDKDNSIDNGMIKGICETLKYTVKEQDLIGKFIENDEANAVWLKRITEQLYKTRKVEYRGVLKEIGKELEDAYNDDDLVTINEDKEDKEDKELEEMVFTWQKALSRYVLVDSGIADDSV